MYCCGFLSTKGKTRKTLTKLEVHDYTVKLNIANSAICGILITPNERFGVKQGEIGFLITVVCFKRESSTLKNNLSNCSGEIRMKVSKSECEFIFKFQATVTWEFILRQGRRHIGASVCWSINKFKEFYSILNSIIIRIFLIIIFLNRSISFDCWCFVCTLFKLD